MINKKYIKIRIKNYSNTAYSGVEENPIMNSIINDIFNRSMQGSIVVPTTEEISIYGKKKY
jgi:hypothetical protein